MEEETPPDGGGPTFRWFLESLVEGGRQLRRVAVHPLPYRIGRRPGLGLTLSSGGVCKAHTEIYVDGGGLRVRDLGSKNGTFLNRRKVRDSPLQEGDILHFAQLEFRLGRQEIQAPGDEGGAGAADALDHEHGPAQAVPRADEGASGAAARGDGLDALPAGDRAARR